MTVDLTADSIIDRVGVIGGGLMGSGIVEVNARAGLNVTLVEVDAEAVKIAEGRVTSLPSSLVARRRG